MKKQRDFVFFCVAKIDQLFRNYFIHLYTKPQYTIAVGEPAAGSLPKLNSVSQLALVGWLRGPILFFLETIPRAGKTVLRSPIYRA